MSTLSQIFSYIKRLFPNPKTELNYNNEFQLVISVILSAQTTDIQVNKTTKELFKIIKNPSEILCFGLDNLSKSISSINLYKTKAKHIFQLSEIIIDKKKLKKLGITKFKIYKDYQLPYQIEDLKKLPGIGEKTAKVVAHILFGAPVIAVDTHVHRVSNRLGIVSTKTPEQTSKLLEKEIPKQYKPVAHHSLILFGRYYCTARKPKCNNCELQKICKRYKENNNNI